MVGALLLHMSQPLINILIRVSRPELFDRCIASARAQVYGNINLLLHCDNEMSYLRCISEFLHKTEDGKYYYTEHGFRGSVVPMETLRHKENYYWNLYCNTLKSKVTDGYLFVMDDDDYLLNPYVIEKLVTHLQDDSDGLICQFLRNGKPKPSNALIAAGVIRKGLIGGGCLVLAAKHAGVADWEAKPAADFDWIAAVASKVKLKFVPLVVQVAGNNGLHGKAAPPIDNVTYERSGE
jgi:hypothetical protein